MKSLNLPRIGRSLILAPAALVLHIAVAANSPDDMLEQQRAILSGRVATHSAATASARREETHSATDPLALTRRVLLGTPAETRHPEHPEKEQGTRHSSAPDVQAWAQHVLAGHPYAAQKS